MGAISQGRVQCRYVCEADFLSSFHDGRLRASTPDQHMLGDVMV